MAWLKVHNEDIVNNTGITLNNPTGSAGIYLLDFKASSIESSAVSVVGAGSATIVITSNKEVRGWGNNLTGGINPNASPLDAYYNGQSATVISGVKQISCGSAGNAYTMAVLENGDLVGWGSNPYRNVNPDSATNPWLDETYVILSGVKKVSCGTEHTMVLMTDGTVRGWGNNYTRQVNPASATHPWKDKTTVILSGVADISCGGEHTMVLMEDGTVRAWGSNSHKQSNPLSGTNPWTNTSNIVVSNAKKIAAGAYQCYVIKNDDTLVDWGANFWKSCNPDSALEDWIDPTITILTDVKDVSGIGQGVIVLHNNGNVVGFGMNIDRNIYPFSSSYRWTDKTAVIISGVSKLAEGTSNNSVVILSDGSVRGWGRNTYRNLKVDSGTNPWITPSTELYNVGVPSATLSWGGGETTNITNDGTYTLSDGTNTIDAQVDYSELASSDKSDYVTVELYNEVTGMYNEGDHFAYAPGDSGGTAVWREPSASTTPITSTHSPGCGYWFKEVGTVYGGEELQDNARFHSLKWIDDNKGQYPWKCLE
jgi:alpha-tubulin suppressor-like RCC1 family protein